MGVFLAVKFPGDSDRTAIIGSSGSGKTTAAAWLLASYDFTTRPYVIVNTKDDPLIAEIAAIPGVHVITLDETPNEPGLYIVNPLPHEQEALNAFFQRIWERGETTVWVDEGYMIEITDAFNALLTQGRSRKIAVIVLSQRPAWISKFVFSEASFVQVFRLGHLDDRKNIAKFVPMDPKGRLPNYHSYWYNVNANEIVRFSPVPPKASIINSFRAKFPPNEAQQAGPAGPLIVEEKSVRRIRVV